MSRLREGNPRPKGRGGCQNVCKTQPRIDRMIRCGPEWLHGLGDGSHWPPSSRAGDGDPLNPWGKLCRCREAEADGCVAKVEGG